LADSATVSNYSSNTWVNVHSTSPLEFESELVQFGITVSGGSSDTPQNPVHRLVVVPSGDTEEKVLYPFENSEGENSNLGNGEYLIYPTISLSKGDVIKVQVNCTDDSSGLSTAKVDFIELKEKR
jgi:hypothetical protein